MIFNGKKLFPRPLVMTALAAARSSDHAGDTGEVASATGEVTSGRRRWMPLVLRWKKTPGTPGAVRSVNHFSSLTNINSFSQLHFHIGQFLINRGITSARANDAGSAAGSLAKMLFDRSSTPLVRASRRKGRSGLYESATRQADGGVERLEKTVREVLLSKERSTAVETSRTIRTFLNRRTDLFHGTVTRRKKIASGPLVAVHPGYQGSTAERVFARAARKHVVDTSAPAAAGGIKRAADLLKTPGGGFDNVFGRRDELVWRRVNNTKLIEEERADFQRSLDQRIEQVSREAASSGRTFSRGGGQTTAGVTVTNLDRATVDRLTNDIIRQVEKRARIERERRGIM